MSDAETKTALPEQYRKAKNARYNESLRDAGNLRRIAYMPSPPHSSIFEALFSKGEVEVDLMADQGADANFISKSLLRKIEQNLPDIQKQTLNPNPIYRGVTGDPCLTCHTCIKLDKIPQIRHGTSLILRNVMWKVGKGGHPNSDHRTKNPGVFRV